MKKIFLEESLHNALLFIWEECENNSDFIDLCYYFGLTDAMIKYLGFEEELESVKGNGDDTDEE